MDKQTQYVSRTLKFVRTFFARWQDAKASLLELTRSHKTMMIVLTRDLEQNGNLLIYCLGPIRIVGPFEWSNCSLDILPVELPNRKTCFKICDTIAGFEILCESVEVKENVKNF